MSTSLKGRLGFGVLLVLGTAILLLLADGSSAQTTTSSPSSVNNGGDVSRPTAALIGAASALAVAAASGGLTLLKDRFSDRRHVRDAEWRTQSAGIDSELKRISAAREATLDLLNSLVAASTTWAQPQDDPKKLAGELADVNQKQALVEFRCRGVTAAVQALKNVRDAVTSWATAIEETALYYQAKAEGSPGIEAEVLPDREPGSRDVAVGALADLDLALDQAAARLSGSRPPDPGGRSQAA